MDEMTAPAWFDVDVTGPHAAGYDVAPEIHAEDFIFVYHVDGHTKRPLAEAAAVYFKDGDFSARELDGLIKRMLPGRSGLSLLEFASGYGCLTRHFKHLRPGYDVTSCDIHPQAVAFIRDVIGGNAVVSDRVPEKLDLGRSFDVVFALSFFSHMPPATFGRWVNRLMDHVALGGVLIMTTHGRRGQAEISVPAMGDDGFWFAPLSEQRDLSTDDYGVSLVRPHVVIDALSERTDCSLRFYQEGFWWGIQDTYVFERVAPGVLTNRARAAAPDTAERDALAAQVLAQQREIAALRNSTSWRLTAPLRAMKDRLRGG